MPSTLPITFPSREVPVPKGVIEVLCLLHSFTIEAVSYTHLTLPTNREV